MLTHISNFLRSKQSTMFRAISCGTPQMLLTEEFSQRERELTDMYTKALSKKAIAIPNPRRPYRLAVIPSDPLDAYVRKGREHTLQDYYNPLGFFDEVYVFSPMESQRKKAWGMEIIPTKAEELQSRLKEFGIHTVRAYGGYWACDMAAKYKLPGVPVVCSVHDTADAYCCKEGVLQADFLWPVSNAVADKLIQKGVQRPKIWLFTNRVDMALFRPLDMNAAENVAFRDSFNERFPGKYRILHIGRKTEQKNPITLIRALAQLGPDYVLIMTGQGDESFLRNEAAAAGVTRQLHLIQTINNAELPYYLNMARAHCTPSLWEGFGVNFIEALATGQVVVTSDIGPMNEYITDGVSGLLVQDYKNPTALADALRRACTDEALRGVLKPMAREAALSFSKDRVDRWEVMLYRMVLNRAFKTGLY
eukprot:Opistho-2@35539